MGSNRILTIEEVCDLVAMSKSTIYRLIKKKQFPSQIRISERRVGFKLSEISNWIEVQQ